MTTIALVFIIGMLLALSSVLCVTLREKHLILKGLPTGRMGIITAFIETVGEIIRYEFFVEEIKNLGNYSMIRTIDTKAYCCDYQTALDNLEQAELFIGQFEPDTKIRWLNGNNWQ
jgi:hypothetical protein